MAATVDLLVSRIGPNVPLLLLFDHFGPIRNTINSTQQGSKKAPVVNCIPEPGYGYEEPLHRLKYIPQTYILKQIQYRFAVIFIYGSIPNKFDSIFFSSAQVNGMFDVVWIHKDAKRIQT